MARGRNWQRRVCELLFVVLAFALLLWAHYRFLTSVRSWANRDFMSLYSGGRTVLEGIDPYEANAWISLRHRLGSTWMPDAGAPFPLWTLMLFAPLAALDLPWAAAVWLVLSEAALLGAVLIAATQSHERPLSGLAFGALAATAFANRAVLATLNNGQVTLALLLALTLFVVWARRRRDVLAGCALALTALKPNPFVLFTPLICLWFIRHRRWRAVAGLVGTGAILMAASWLMRPGWLLAWTDVRGKAAVACITPTIWGLAFELSQQWWALIGLVATVVVTGGVGWIAYTRRRVSIDRVVCIGLCASLIVTPYTWAYEHALLLLPVAACLAYARRRAVAWLIWLGLVVVAPWAMYKAAGWAGRDTWSTLVPIAVALIVTPLLRHQVDQSHPIQSIE